MSAADRIRLQHMMDAAMEAMAFAKGNGPEQLSDNRMLFQALVRDLEIVGEAASQISEEFRSLHPEVPWALIRGMRNRLIHAYWDVKIEVVWSTVVEDLPELLRTVDALLAATPENEGGTT